MRGTDAASLVAQQGEEAYGGSAKLGRDVFEGGHVDRNEEHRQANDQHHPRPDDLSGTDVQIHERHPVVPARHDQEAQGDQPAGVDSPADQAPTAISPIMEKTPDGDCTKPET